jgi:hypothetical protein
VLGGDILNLNFAILHKTISPKSCSINAAGIFKDRDNAHEWNKAPSKVRL